MSFSAVCGISLKLSRLFLKICKWVLVNMSLKCKLSGLSGRLSTDYQVKFVKGPISGSLYGNKWRRLHFYMWLTVILIGFIWFLTVLSNGGPKRKVDASDICEDKDRILLKHLNVSKEELHALASSFFKSDQITSLKCTKQSRVEMSTSNIIGCALKLSSLENQKFEEQHGWDAKDAESWGQCPAQHSVLNKCGSMYITYIYVAIKFAKNAGRTMLFENLAREHCQNFYFCLMKICWWVLIGIGVSCHIPGLNVMFWRNQEEKLVEVQPLPEQRQLLQLQQHKQQQQAQISSRSAGKWRKKLLLIFVLAGVIGSIWLFWYLNEDISFRRKETLANMCDERARMLQDQFNVSMNHVHALAILVSTFHHGKKHSAIDQKTFGEYTERTAFERPLTSGVAYALRVPHHERERFEKKHGWTIRKMETEDQTLVQDCIPENLDPSPVQDEYAPVIFSQETVSHIVSIDMMSGKLAHDMGRGFKPPDMLKNSWEQEDRENILRARASEKGVLTSPFKLLKSNHLGVVLTFAVYSSQLPPGATSEQRINATVGYLGASYDVPSLVEKLLHQLASKQNIVVNVYDTTNQSEPINMYGTNVIDTGLLHISNLDFGDPARKHEMHCRFKQRPSPPWTAITASVGVLVITLLLGHIFHAAINRIAKVEHDYREMMELKHRAEAADIAKSQFLATVSHEIRTPMNGVLGMLRRLMDTNLDADQLDYAQTAHASGKDLISLLNEVLDQAKIESGRLELEAVHFDLRAVLDHVLSLFSGKSHEKGVELAIYVSEQVPEVVVGDPGRFRQIITNLVGNSIKFTQDKGHIFISVHLADEVSCQVDVKDEVLRQSLTEFQGSSSTSYNTLSGFPVVDRWKSWESFTKLRGTESAKESEMVKVLVTVEDTGVGILPEAQSRIFMPFMQADSSTSRTYAFAIGETSSLDTKSRRFHPAVEEFRGLKALVVDGKNIRAEVARYHLQRLGISVDRASSLDSACSNVSSNSDTSASAALAFILVDQDVCDEEAGLSLHHQLKELRRKATMNMSPTTPKIFLLATSIGSTKCNLKSAGLVDNVLTKPLRLSVLISCFQATLKNGKKTQIRSGKPTVGSLLRSKKILVVDDNLVNRRVAEGALKKYGAIVTCAESGKAALRMLKPPHDFDACFMDLQMPEMDGFEATRRIRSLESTTNEKIGSDEASTETLGNVAHWHTPILAMTADVIQARNEECMKCGMDGYVLKPFEEEQLYSAAARFFEYG
ncbi:hypothetical protein RJ639_036187 [Escallonia herrerae]|uniref:histidine kinase n=1 Tax=Escallonia herrerae TaxID=1293975 RepID=A0AA89BCE9_9ASTE|nr:hypothetical protein RJ639_036187 [Escallonia herrerae]